MPTKDKAERFVYFDAQDITCKHCGQSSIHRISVIGHYTELFSIPLFPTHTSVFAECELCNGTIEKEQFSYKLNQKCFEKRTLISSPIRHYLGSAIFGVCLVALFILKPAEKVDYRSGMLNLDISLMSTFPTFEKDSISVKVQAAFAKVISMDLDPSTFKYYSEIRANRAIVMVTIPGLDRVRENLLIDGIDIVEYVTSTQADLDGKHVFIGLRSNRKFLAIKTPAYLGTGDKVSQSAMYRFYGKPKPE